MAENQMKKMLEGAAVLTVASFIAKVLSALYRIPLQNIVGDEGFYVYQQVYPLYGVAMTFALTGFPQFLSKLVAGEPTPRKKQQVLRQAYPLLCWTAFILWSLSFFFSHPIASLMGDTSLQPVIRTVSFTFLIMPVLSLYRGFFQGNFLLIPTAVSQVVEQLLRVAIILLAAAAFSHFSLTVYQTGTWAMTGALAGGFAAALVLMYYDRKIYGISYRLRYLSIKKRVTKKFARIFFVEGGIVALYSGLLILFQLLDSFLIVNSLSLAGVAVQSAKVAKGIYDRGQPFVQLGLVIATSLSATFLPALTKYAMQKKQEKLVNSAKIYLRVTTAVATAASLGLALLMPYLNFALFKDQAAMYTLIVFVFAVALMSIIQAYQSVAQSRNRILPTFKAALSGLGVKLAATFFLTLKFGTLGASLATVLGLVTVLGVLVKHEEKKINIFWTEKAFGKKLLKCLLVMTLVLIVFLLGSQLFLSGLSSRFSALLFSLLGVGAGVAVFIKAAIYWQLFSLREWLMLPLGTKILRIGEKK